MAITKERLGGDLLETLVIDPNAITSFDVPRAALRFSDKTLVALTPWKGLRELGPYDLNTDDEFLRRKFERCEVLCTYPAGRKDIEQDLAKLSSFLKNGYSAAGRSYDTDFASFQETFQMDNAIFPEVKEFVPYSLDDLDSFRRSVVTLAEDIKQRGNRALVLVAIESHKSLTTETDVYAPLKRTLNRADIPNQFLSDFVTE